MAQNPQSRKWQITLNNPDDKGFNHERIKEELNKLKSIIYWCMADEIGEERTPHTHIYLVCSSPVRFSTLKNLFEAAHIERANSTSQDNRNYILKSGKWEDTEKAETSVEGSFEEWGEMPQEHQGYRSDVAALYERIKDGASDFELLEENPDNMAHLTNIEKTRLIIKNEEYRDTFRQLEVTYIWGETATGKTRYVMDKYGYTAVYRVTDYKSHPFDLYKGEDVLLLDEYRSQFPITDILNLLDGYPLTLSARYANKQACYTKVYIISNILLKEQYPNIQTEQPATFRALLRRINEVIHFPLPEEPPKQATFDDFIEIESEDNPF